ncbi:hypothetical protein Taro_030510 [Colocasia esculenta]|uniref:Cytochrome P450 n=1 Tax=Colocasia esculenta TaxID=4460 RepID=A0A843VY59_COLES|nr:hypothetical protein [Colocasia esculenta]
MASVVASAMGVLNFVAAHLEVHLAIPVFLFISHQLIRYVRGQRSLVYFPTVGALPSLLLNLHRLHDWMTGAMEERGCTFMVTGPWFSGMKYLFTADPENVRYVTSTNFGNFVKGSHLREMLEEFGDNVSSADFDVWRSRRKIVTGHLHQREFLQSTRGVIHDKVETGLLPLLAQLAQPGAERMTIDMREVLQRFTFDVMCLLVFGVDVGSLSIDLPRVPFMDAVDNVVEASFLRFALPRSCWKLLRWLRMGPEKKLADSMEVVNDFINKFIASRKDEVSKTGHVGSKEPDAPADLLTCLLGQQMADGASKFSSDKSIRDLTFELLIAGKYSTSLSVAWFLWMVSTHRSVETRILDELASAAPRDGNNKYVTFDAEELDGCVYLTAAIHECLRLFPVMPFTPRWALRHDVLPSGHKVEPGTLVVYSAYAMGRMEAVWGEDRLDFTPERWISSQGKVREESSFKFTAFGAGPRICFGKTLALAEIRAVAAAVIYNFRLELAGQVSARSNIVLNMENGLVCSLQERHPR